MLQACHRPELLLRGAEVYLPYLLMRHEQHVACHDLCNGRHIQVQQSCITCHHTIFRDCKLQPLLIFLLEFEIGWRR